MTLKVQQAFLPDKLSPSPFSCNQLEKPPVPYPHKPCSPQAVEQRASGSLLEMNTAKRQQTIIAEERGAGDIFCCAGFIISYKWFVCWGFFHASSYIPLPYKGHVHVHLWTEEPSGTVKLSNISCLIELFKPEHFYSLPWSKVWFGKAE